MIKYVVRCRNYLVVVKHYVHRSTLYLQLVNVAMLTTLFMDAMKSKGFAIDGKVAYPAAIAVLILSMLFLGWADDVSGVHKQEMRHAFDRSPHVKEIIERLDRIEKKV